MSLPTDEQTKRAALAAWEFRRARHRDDAEYDNAAMQAGAPCLFHCPSCFGPIILAEGYLTRPELCYDCRDLADNGWLVKRRAIGWSPA